MFLSDDEQSEVIEVFKSPSRPCKRAFEPPHDDKTYKMTVRPARTQISLGIRPVAQADLSLHWAHMPYC